MKHTPPDVAVQAGNPNTGYSCGPITKYNHRGDVTDAGKNDCTHGRAQGTVRNRPRLKKSCAEQSSYIGKGGVHTVPVCVFVEVM